MAHAYLLKQFDTRQDKGGVIILFRFRAHIRQIALPLIVDVHNNNLIRWEMETDGLVQRGG